MAYDNGGCGKFEPAQLRTSYRGLKFLATAPANIELTVVSGEVEQSLVLAPGELFSGTLIITSVDSGDATLLKGYSS